MNIIAPKLTKTHKIAQRSLRWINLVQFALMWFKDNKSEETFSFKLDNYALKLA